MQRVVRKSSIRDHSFTVLIALLLAACLCRPVGFCQFLGPSSAIVTDFTKAPRLSDAEIKSVIKVSHRAGLTNVVQIYTYYIHPTDSVGIGVKGPESKDGRTVSFVTADVATEGLLDELSRNLTNILSSDGKYWVRRGDIRTNTLSLFETKGRTIRVKLEGKVTLEQADRFLAALSAGKIRYADERTKEEASSVDLLTPTVMYWRPTGAIQIGFSCGESCQLSLDCVLDNGWILVSNPRRVVA